MTNATRRRTWDDVLPGWRHAHLTARDANVSHHTHAVLEAALYLLAAHQRTEDRVRLSQVTHEADIWDGTGECPRSAAAAAGRQLGTLRTLGALHLEPSRARAGVGSHGTECQSSLSFRAELRGQAAPSPRRDDMNRRLVTGALSALLILVGLTACEPPTPRAQLVVDTTAVGSDANPGDGVCASDGADGGCTLQAAVAEANALGKADITVPAGKYVFGELTVTGDVAILGAGFRQTELGGLLVVAEQAALRMDGAGSTISGPGPTPFSPTLLSIRVGGSLNLTRSYVLQIGEAVVVQPTGGVVIRNSILDGAYRPLQTTGKVIIDSSTVGGSSTNLSVDALTVGGDGAAAARGSWFFGNAPGSVSCTGTPPISLGYNHSGDSSCGFSAVGDATGEKGSAFSEPPIGSARVDAIPLGTGACVTGATDALGNPRGVDGNGDGVGGCDIGAIERQPAV